MWTTDEILLLIIAFLILILIVVGTLVAYYYRERNSCYDYPSPMCYTDWKCLGPAYGSNCPHPGTDNGQPTCNHPLSDAGYTLPSCQKLTDPTASRANANALCPCGAELYDTLSNYGPTVTNTITCGGNPVPLT